MPPRTPPPFRRLLDLLELHEPARLAELIRQHEGVPEPRDLSYAPLISSWSIAAGELIIGLDQHSNVVVRKASSIAPDKSWASTPSGNIRLRDRSRVPLARWKR